VFSTPIASLRCVRRDRPTALACTFYEPALSIVAQGCKQVLVAGKRYTYDEAHYLLTSVAFPATSRVMDASPSHPFLGVALRLDLPLVGQLMSEIDSHPSPARAPRPGLTVSPVTEPLLDAILRLVRLAQTPQDVPALAPLIEREILYRLLTGEQACHLRDLAVHNGHAHQVAKAIARLRLHFARPLYIADLAKAAAMSPSSLHHHFKIVTGMSPLQYQKHMRLQEARKMMLTGVDVSTASQQVGYESPSHFSRDYSRVYGTPPAKDIQPWVHR
jgi:AraC-like DNA-binding protein